MYRAVTIYIELDKADLALAGSRNRLVVATGVVCYGIAIAIGRQHDLLQVVISIALVFLGKIVDVARLSLSSTACTLHGPRVSSSLQDIFQ